MARKAFMFTPGDGRPSANAFWMPEHLKLIPKIEAQLQANDLEIVWLHPKTDTISSHTLAAKAGKKLMAEMAKGDKLIALTTGWDWPAHAGIIFTMAQDAVRNGSLQIINVCNMQEKCPGYVGQRANVLALEILQIPYDCLTIIHQDSAGWIDFGEELKAVLAGTYKPEIPSEEVELTIEHEKTVREAIKYLKMSGGVVPLVNMASMTMYQGLPNLFEFLKLGLTPVVVGSHEFEEQMYKISQKAVDAVYAELKERGLKFEYRPHGLTRREVDLAIQMYLVKLGWWRDGCAGMGTQGQMEQVRIVATDLSESLMMSTFSPGKVVPVIDVTEADCEALISSLLGQAILYVKTGLIKPVGFHDVRHYMSREDTLVLLNSGALSLDFMTDTPGDYSDITFVSQDRKVYFLNGGACVYGNMRPSQGNTLFRLHASGPTYKMLTTRMDVLPLSWEHRNKVYGKLDRWPMGIVKIPGGATKATTLNWLPNHGQHVAYDIRAELAMASKLLGYEHHCFAK